MATVYQALERVAITSAVIRNNTAARPANDDDFRALLACVDQLASCMATIKGLDAKMTREPLLECLSQEYRKQVSQKKRAFYESDISSRQEPSGDSNPASGPNP